MIFIGKAVTTWPVMQLSSCSALIASAALNSASLSVVLQNAAVVALLQFAVFAVNLVQLK